MSAVGRRWRRVLLVALLLLLAVPLGLVALLASERGSAWLLHQAGALARPAGVELAIAQSAGSLLRRIELGGVVFAGFDTRVEIDTLVLDWRPRALIERRVHLHALEVHGVRIVLPPPAESSDSEPLRIPEISLPVALQIDRLLVQDLKIDQPDGPISVDRVALAVGVDAAGLRLDELEILAEGAQLDGALAMQAAAPRSLDGRVRVQLDERLTGADIGPLIAQAELAGDARRPAFTIRLEAPAELRLRGDLVLETPELVFDLMADWERIAWPVQGTPQVVAESGQVTLRGRLDDYRLSLNSGLRGEGLPMAELALEAQGDQRQLELQPLSLTLGSGRLQATGGLRWDSGIGGQLELLAEELNPGLLLADWPGEIDARIALVGSQADTGDLELRAEIAELGGRLRGYPLGAGGAITLDAGRLDVAALRVVSGANRIDVDGHIDLAGRLDRPADLRLKIAAPDLASFYPGLRGRLEGNGRVGGTPTRPTLIASLSGAGLGYDDLAAQSLALDVDWAGEDGSATARLAGLDLAGFALTTVAADLSGSRVAHRLGLQLAGPELTLDLDATGGLSDQTWRGALQRLNLGQEVFGDWRLAARTALEIGAARVQSEQLCLRQDGSSLCAGGTWDERAGLNLNASLVDLDLARFAPLIPGEAAVEGLLGAELVAIGAPDAPEITFDLHPGDGRIRLDQGDNPFDLAYRDARISGRFADDRGTAELRFELASNGRAEGRLSLGAAQAGQRALGGELRANFPDLALVEGFVPALQAVQGQLAVDVALAGTLDDPRVHGSLAVSQASARLPDAGIVLQAVSLQVTGDQNSPLQVEARAESGKGRLDIEGQVDPFAPGGALVDLALRGSDFEALRLPEAQVLLAPDLTLRGQGPYHLSGTLRIPKAAVELKELPQGSVAVSADEVLISESGGPAGVQDAAATGNLTADVRVELGKAVSFKGFGLSTDLVGALRAKVDADFTTVDGAIELLKGRYKAYGQDLDVESGRLVFTGVPDNPAIDLRAKRISRDTSVTAYLALSGPLAEPQARVYSEPSLPQAEALAHLVTGRGLDQAGREEGADIASAALSLGVARGEPLLQGLSDRLGLDELRFDSGDDGLESSSLVVGRYLNPNLYLGYSQGLFSPEGAVLLRLGLTEQLELETRSGSEQSVDLLYKIEHD